ncbi:MAG: carbon starvation CstA family protein [Spirochaetota bacterium]
MIAVVVISSIIVLAAGYIFYGKFVANIFALDNMRKTPAVEMNDGMDYVPAKPSLLLSQHFSAISAAGPIVGPILAGIWFGWLPALLWIVIGSIFIGGVHDMGSLVASIRNKASSIGEIVKSNMSRRAQILFLIFVWFALVYVIIAFADITAQSFRSVASGDAYGPGVAASSAVYLALGLLMGVLMRKTKLPLALLTAVFVPLVIGAIFASTKLPPEFGAFVMQMPHKGWVLVLLAYCFIASLLPMWLLLQPRGYLGGWFLYLVMGIALIGAVLMGGAIQYPMINLKGLAGIESGKLVFPFLFITVACGACSGFHSIVSSGTTSKQIEKESDTRVVGYGAMILEGVVAVLALATVMMLAKGDAALKSDPNMIFANGIAKYLSAVGIDAQFALSFALVAFATFVYDTLDVTTRLARYIFQEIFGLNSLAGGMLATAATLSLPALFLMLAGEKGYLVAWPIFGTSNQLLAALTLLAISVWLVRTKRNALIAIIPMLFMLAFTLWSLVSMLISFISSIPAISAGTYPKPAAVPTLIIGGVCGIVLLALSFLLLIEAYRSIRWTRKKA